MASKGKGKGKGKGNQLETVRKSTVQYEGALDNSYLVMAENKVGNWRRARIIDCRLAKDYDITKKKQADSYQYYVHYQKEDKRLDQWVILSRIRPTDEIINDDIPKKKKRNAADDQHDNTTHKDDHQDLSRLKSINSIQMGVWRCDAWYYSPYPIIYNNTECLYICDMCLSFFVTEEELGRHFLRCQLKHPPGDEIYRDWDEELAVFQVDGQKSPIYCQNLSYLSKLFLDHKTLYYDTTPFLFFILCQIDKKQSRYHITGYFSRQKQSNSGFNLSCILVLPFHQRKGLGKFMVGMSYELSLRQAKIGTPETPLSDLGRALYMSWWTQRIIKYIQKHPTSFSIADLTKQTGIKEGDAYECMQKIGIIKISQGQLILCTDPVFLKQLYTRAGHPGKPVKSQLIHYVPFKLRWDSTPTQL